MPIPIPIEITTYLRSRSIDVPILKIRDDGHTVEVSLYGGRTLRINRTIDPTKMKLPELRARCRALNINTNGLCKQDLIHAIRSTEEFRPCPSPSARS